MGKVFTCQYLFRTQSYIALPNTIELSVIKIKVKSTWALFSFDPTDIYTKQSNYFFSSNVIQRNLRYAYDMYFALSYCYIVFLFYARYSVICLCTKNVKQLLLLRILYFCVSVNKTFKCKLNWNSFIFGNKNLKTQFKNNQHAFTTRWRPIFFLLLTNSCYFIFSVNISAVINQTKSHFQVHRASGLVLSGKKCRIILNDNNITRV